MKKICFEDKVQLTKSVLDGKKHQYRQFLRYGMTVRLELEKQYKSGRLNDFIPFMRGSYKKGDVIAVAQTYEDVKEETGGRGLENIDPSAPGWKMKIFVHPEFMPHQIEITDVRMEKLQDISDSDCIAEGVIPDFSLLGGRWKYFVPGFPQDDFVEPKDAFKEIVKIAKPRGAWEDNQFVMVYDFKLIK